MIKRIVPSLGICLSLSGLSACAEERPLIDRVQPNALDKSFFVGALDDQRDDPVFFSRQFAVDGTESEALIGISASSGLERIRWEITEEMLFARRAYSVTDGEHRGTGEKTDGIIVAAYKIEKHFDIRKAYNSATGEELNVEEENTRDRPWNQRAQMRIDWSQNLVNTPVWTRMFFGSVFGNIKLTPVVYDVSDPDSEDGLHFSPDEGYFDLTSHFVVEPQSARFGNFEFPLCLWIGAITGSAIFSCDPQEAVVRSSYWRVSEADPDDDFEPFENTEAPLDIMGNPGGIGASGGIGIVSAPLEQFDPAAGYTDEGMTRFMNRHNLWAQNHQTVGSCASDSDCRGSAVCLDSGACSVPCSYEARHDAKGNGTDDQCENKDTDYEGLQGSQCSPRNRCTIPYRDRQISPVAYTMNPEMVNELQDTVDKSGRLKKRGASEDLLATWNQALQLAVARAREVECRRTSNSPSSSESRQKCHEEFFVMKGGKDKTQMVSYGGWGIETPSDKTDVLVSCHNPVRSYDPEVCGDEGEIARVGDLRRNFLIYWPYNTRSPYGGIGNWRGDPLTGNIIGAAATTIGRSATRSAGQVRDIVMVALGELDLSDILDGVSATRYQQVLRNGPKSVALTEEEIARRLAAIDSEHLVTQASVGITDVREVGDIGAARLELKANLTLNQGNAALEQQKIAAAAKPLLGTQFELNMVDSSWLVDSIGLSPSTQLNDEVLEQVSPLRGQDIGNMALADQQLMAALGAQGVCHLDNGASIGNPDIHGLGLYFRKKYPDLTGEKLADAIYQDLWKETYKGIQLHELGHSLGLLHNFTSSYDSMNYNPQYWQLRTHEGQSVQTCGGLPRQGDPSSVSGDTCMGPRYLDPQTDDELGRGSEPRPGVNYFGHTSSMEYQNTRFFETVGLGQYDVMAMGMLYGKVLQTFDPTEIPSEQQKDFETLHRSQLSEDLFVIGTRGDGSRGIQGRHYTQLARDMKIFDPSRCRDATDKELEHAEWRIVHGQVCAPPPKDYGHWDDFANESDPSLTLPSQRALKLRVSSTTDAPASGNVRWPYRYGGDQINGYPHVNPFDSGADHYEITQETITKNDYNYPFAYFRRQRRGWTSMGLPSYTARRFYERLRSYHWGTSFVNTFYQELSDQNPQFRPAIEGLRNDDNELRPALLAQVDMLHAIVSTLMTPEPGSYGMEEATGVFNLGGSSFVLDASDGRFLAPAFDSGPTKGGAWDYQSFMVRAGFRVEKAIAARILTDGRPVFFSTSRDNYLDSRRVYINFRSNMPKAVDRLLGGMLAEDWDTIAPYIEGTANADINMRDLVSDSLEEPLPTGTRAVFPNLGYNQQLPAVIFAQLFGRVNGDMELSNKLRIWLDGSISGQLNIPEAEQIRFTDPDSGITYIARLFGPEVLYGKTVDTGIGSRMLERANTLLVSAFEQAVDEDGEPQFDEFQRPLLATDENGSALRIEESAATHTRFRNYVGTLDASVQINTLIGYGPFNFF